MTRTVSTGIEHRASVSRVRQIVELLTVAAILCCGQGCDHVNDGRQANAVSAAGRTAPDRLEPVVQVGHPRPLRHIVFSPDGKTFLTTAGDDDTVDPRVLLWDATSSELLRTLPSGGHWLRPRFCLGGEAVAIAGNVWDRQTGHLRLAVLKNDAAPVDWEVSADGRRLIVGTRSDVHAVDLETGRTFASLSTTDLDTNEDSANQSGGATAPRVRAVGFTAANVPMTLLTDKGDHLAVWNAATGQKQAHLPTDYHDTARLSPGASYVVTRYWDDTGSSTEIAVVYDAATGKRILCTDEPTYPHESVLFTADERYCITGTGRRKATLWELMTGEVVHHFVGSHAEPIDELLLLDEGRVLETRSRDVAQRWDVMSGECVAAFRVTIDAKLAPRIQHGRRSLPMIVPSPDGTTFARGQQIFDAGGQLLRQLEPLVARNAGAADYRDLAAVTHSIYTPDGNKILVAWVDRYHRRSSQAVLFDVASGETVRRIAMSLHPTNYELKFNRDGRRALTEPGRVHRLWDVEHGRPLQTIGRVWHRCSSPRPRIAFSANGRFVYIYGRQVGVFFWDAETGRARHHDPPGKATPDKRGLIDDEKHGDYYRGRSIVSPEVGLAASWYYLPEERWQRLTIWDVEQGEVLHTLDHSPHMPRAPHFSPDGRRLAVVCNRAAEGRQLVPDRLAMWDLESGEQLYAIKVDHEAHHHGAPSVHFLSDGKRMLVNSAWKELTLHDVATGKLVHRMVGNPPTFDYQREGWLRQSLLLSPDERYVVVGYSSRHAIVWDLRTGEQVRLIARDMGGIVTDEYFRFSDDSRRLLAPFEPATLWGLKSGETTVFEDRSVLKDLPGFSFAKTGAPETAGVPLATLDRFKEHLPKTVRKVEQTADGKRLLVYHDDGGIASWDVATGKPIHRCYLFHVGSRWLTVMPDGTCRGNLEYVRFRKIESD